MPIATPPCNCPETSSGTICVPHSSQVLCERICTLPVPLETATSIIVAQGA